MERLIDMSKVMQPAKSGTGIKSQQSGSRLCTYPLHHATSHLLQERYLRKEKLDLSSTENSVFQMSREKKAKAVSCDPFLSWALSPKILFYKWANRGIEFIQPVKNCIKVDFPTFM